MARKRKRSGVDASDANIATRSKVPVKRDLLELCYPQVHTLRGYLLEKLPGPSRLRRKKIASIGVGEAATDLEARLADLLDNALVSSTERPDGELRELRWQQWLGFSQQAGDESYVTISGTPESASHLHTGIVDFVIWLLFTRHKSDKWPKHLLCDGFRKGAGNGEKGGCNIPGLFSRFPNSNVKTLKDAPWPQVLALLGKSGERIMIDMLVDCSVFLPVEAGYGNYYQLSGVPLSEVDIHKRTANGGQDSLSICRKPSNISLVRSRLFYAKPALTSQGIVQAGLKHIHVLNRCLRLKINDETPSANHESLNLKNMISKTKVMMYIFPRQFGLHNVFTSEVNRKQTAQKFQDYTLREEEIKAITQTAGSSVCLPKIPKRLRHAAEHLVERLQVLHGRCSYLELLRHYCPTSFDPPRQGPGNATAKPNRKTRSRPQPSQIRSGARRSARGTQNSSQIRYNSIAELACPTAHVSAFCQAALSRVIPNGFWGEGDTGEHNKKMIMNKVHHFVKLNRFETISLHEIAQDLRIVDIPWLRPPKLEGLKTSQTDINKRYEVFHEFLYYVFDSFLMPLIRSNFYVTESNTHRYQIFYFRHDVWKRVAEPAMAALKEKMFEEVKSAEAVSILSSRNLGFSNVRLLPKGKDLRPIMNLRKRAFGVGRDRAATLGLSINTLLGPVHTALKLEQRTNPSRLGSTLFSVNDIYIKLKDFKTSLGSEHGPLYFAKLDIRAAFDTIPQDAVVRLMASVPTQDQYTIVKHAEVKPAERTVVEANQTATKPMRKWRAQALNERDASNFTSRLEHDLARRKKNTVFIDSAMRATHESKKLMALLKEHVTNNLVKIGKKYYRQKAGIPQGSVLSSFLANYFYADLEVHYLDFLDEDCLLLRLIDDFLLITLDLDKAKCFVETLHAGVPDYGVEVNPNKTLVNFNMNHAGAPLKKSTSTSFPYCGTAINTQTLDITKDRQKSKGSDVSNSLTIEFGRAPGQNFERKVLNAFKIQSHLMFFDTTHNSTKTVMSTLHGAFTETATKMWAYVRCMPKKKRPRAKLILRTITKVIDVAFLLLTSRSRKMRFEQYDCDIRKGQVALAACRAFLQVLERKQAGYEQVTVWLRREQVRLGSN